jgi:hypothetical protein
MKVVRLSALRTGRLYPHPGNIPGTHFCWRLSRPHGHSAARRIMSMKNSNGTIGNRTRDLPACSTGPQPTASIFNMCSSQSVEAELSGTSLTPCLWCSCFNNCLQDHVTVPHYRDTPVTTLWTGILQSVSNTPSPQQAPHYFRSGC